MRGSTLRPVGDRRAAARRLPGIRFLPACVLIAACVIPASARADDLTPPQEVRAKSVEQKLISPCCYRETVADHRSNMASTLRAEVRLMAAQGATEQEILDHFVAKYGERILVVPRVRGFNLLVYVMPVLAVAAGCVIILALLRRARKTEHGDAVGGAPGRPPGTDLDAGLKARLTEELDRFSS